MPELDIVRYQKAVQFLGDDITLGDNSWKIELIITSKSNTGEFIHEVQLSCRNNMLRLPLNEFLTITYI